MQSLFFTTKIFTTYLPTLEHLSFPKAFYAGAMDLRSQKLTFCSIVRAFGDLQGKKGGKMFLRDSRIDDEQFDALFNRPPFNSPYPILRRVLSQIATSLSSPERPYIYGQAFVQKRAKSSSSGTVTSSSTNPQKAGPSLSFFVESVNPAVNPVSESRIISSDSQENSKSSNSNKLQKSTSENAATINFASSTSPSSDEPLVPPIQLDPRNGSLLTHLLKLSNTPGVQYGRRKTALFPQPKSIKLVETRTERAKRKELEKERENERKKELEMKEHHERIRMKKESIEKLLRRRERAKKLQDIRENALHFRKIKRDLNDACLIGQRYENMKSFGSKRTKRENDKNLEESSSIENYMEEDSNETDEASDMHIDDYESAEYFSHHNFGKQLDCSTEENVELGTMFERFVGSRRRAELYKMVTDCSVGAVLPMKLNCMENEERKERVTKAFNKMSLEDEENKDTAESFDEECELKGTLLWRCMNERKKQMTLFMFKFEDILRKRCTK
ncbi:uncharacterized protein MONOS_13599 [Monocercomonoides exilis]|uniref:uncharacterized protein n=1 Tax=Monocercomonoides exilis TaxID=2049356 RepID=UPI00355A9A1B|nr:hypothetical protein MONOS_13599 [Monocercomonoides exilis]|eukprot:MONOS_13599.1-p1 / transcript=MONOS_13599.1 / gene=MONOS_13599 / organism=Monocercomonoides_exilis_PA203 / gene_product=unspecified product / transcript_product=unspecified product / location=Mono_scaffold00851:21012-22567(+) / protein_length=502 / sequence_SO=supercontig / SO=protein_coding / is_pseudo=false